MIKKNIYLMYAISFLQGMVFYGSIATLYRQVSGLSILEITIIESISLVLCLILEIPWGIVADKIGCKKVMVICSVLFFISKIVFWQSSDFFGFLTERLILGVVFAGLSGVDINILFLSGKEGQSQHVFGVYESLQRAGLLISTIVFSLFVSSNYRGSAFLTIIPYAIAAILSFFLSEVKPLKKLSENNSEKGFVQTLFAVINNKYLVLLIVGMAFFNETHQVITVFFNQLQYVKSGMSDSAIGFAFIITGIIGLLSFLSLKITRRISSRRTIVYSFAALIISCCVLALTDSAVISILAVLIIRFAFVIFMPLQNTIKNTQVTSANRVTTLSTFSMISSSIGILLNIAFGRLAQADISLAFYFGAVICVVGLAFIAIWSRNEGQNRT